MLGEVGALQKIPRSILQSYVSHFLPIHLDKQFVWQQQQQQHVFTYGRYEVSSSCEYAFSNCETCSQYWKKKFNYVFLLVSLSLLLAHSFKIFFWWRRGWGKHFLEIFFAFVLLHFFNLKQIRIFLFPLLFIIIQLIERQIQFQFQPPSNPHFHYNLKSTRVKLLAFNFNLNPINYQHIAWKW